MTYHALTEAMRRFGRASDLCRCGLGVDGDRISKTVILSPGWPPQRVAGLGPAQVLVESGPLYGLTVWQVDAGPAGPITYIKTGCGAPAVLDTLLSLGETKCGRVLFLSSVGALDPAMAVGDLVLPEWSMSGDGASRYLRENLSDCFGQKAYPDSGFLAALASGTQTVCQKTGLAWHVGRPFCTDTFLAQFPHIPAILEMGCNALDMESAVAFRAGALVGLPVAALLCVSDNSAVKKSLLGGVTDEEQRRRAWVRGEVIPKIIRLALQDPRLADG